jgi:hypothetical protein
MRLFAWLLGSAPAWCSRSAGTANAYFRERAPVCDLVEARGPERRLPDVDARGGDAATLASGRRGRWSTPARP